MSPQQQNSHYFTSDPGWRLYAEGHSLPLGESPQEIPPLDIANDRKAEHLRDIAWEFEHPLSSIGYASRVTTICGPGGREIEIKCYRSTRVAENISLPLLFVCHGGGWTQGSCAREERWLLWPILTKLDVCMISVSYRLAPEVPFEDVLADCWDALNYVISDQGQKQLALNFDLEKVILTGSSAGGALSATLSQKVKDQGNSTKIKAVLLNVPVTCDPRHFPTKEYELLSYDQCHGTTLTGGIMRQIWKVVVPDEQIGKEAHISPLLGDLSGLPEHIVYVAGQDPLRDEGIAYAKKLDEAGTKVKLRIYSGVPHTFGEIWELDVTKQFWVDLTEDLARIIG